MVVEWFLHILNHQNEILLQSNRQFIPFDLVANAINHPHIAFGSHFAKIAIDQEA